MFAKNTSEHWAPQRLRKYSFDGVERAVHPRSTIRRARKTLSRIGVTTVSDVTGLDRVGIPNFMTVRPKDLGPGISYYNGKGVTKDDAHAGALMEALERHAGEKCCYPVTVSTYNALSRHNRVINPSEMIVPPLRPYSNDLEIEWVPGFDLVKQVETFVPLNLVVCPYISDFPALWLSNTNGLASGNFLTEALCHALCEIIERDAQAMAMAEVRLRPIVHGLVDISLVQATSQSTEFISENTLHPRAARLLRKIKRAGLTVVMRNLSRTAGIATIDCVISEPNPDSALRRFGGLGTHPDSRVAITRALTEAAQSRLSFIQGGREDMEHILGGLQQATGQETESESGPQIDFKSIPCTTNDFVDEDVTYILNALPGFGLSEAIAFDLTVAEVGVPVVKVVVPRAETWAVFHLHAGRGMLGSRALSLISRTEKSES